MQEENFNIIELVSLNKEWLFSGAGVVIAVSVVKIFLPNRPSKSYKIMQKQVSGDDAKQSQIGNIEKK